MDVGAFCRLSRVIVVAGKGGVGKTTVAAALARVAARAGLDVLVVELEGKPEIPRAFGLDGALAYDELELPLEATGRVRARRVTPDEALVEYLSDHGLKRLSRRLVATGVLDVVATAVPGLRDLLVLGKVKQLERQRAADLLILDAPATGHAMTFLSSPRGLADAARSGPVRQQATEVLEMLGDPSRCQVLLVTLPEEMPVNETVEAAYALEERIGVALAPLVVNGCTTLVDGLAEALEHAMERRPTGVEDHELKRLVRAARFSLARAELQQEQLDRLAQELALYQLRVPFVPGAPSPVALTERVAGALEDAIGGFEPERSFSVAPKAPPQ
jgi:anion-transporting  ArsA/GET3 family ATPase